MREWVKVGWHLDGMTYDRYLQLTWRERWDLHFELDDIIDRTAPEGEMARPKSWRK